MGVGGWKAGPGGQGPGARGEKQGLGVGKGGPAAARRRCGIGCGSSARRRRDQGTPGAGGLERAQQGPPGTRGRRRERLLGGGATRERPGPADRSGHNGAIGRGAGKWGVGAGSGGFAAARRRCGMGCVRWLGGGAIMCPMGCILMGSFGRRGGRPAGTGHVGRQFGPEDELGEVELLCRGGGEDERPGGGGSLGGNRGRGRGLFFDCGLGCDRRGLLLLLLLSVRRRCWRSNTYSTKGPT